jgi:hypothetical protein
MQCNLVETTAILTEAHFINVTLAGAKTELIMIILFKTNMFIALYVFQSSRILNVLKNCKPWIVILTKYKQKCI